VTDTDVLDAIARGLAALTDPDLSAFTRDEVDLAMVRAFDGARDAWLAQLGEQVLADSGGFTRMELVTPADVPVVNKDPSTAYARLVGSFVTRLAMIGPFQPPVQYF
jgi:hypothetical protein